MGARRPTCTLDGMTFAGVVLPGQGRVFPTGRSQASVKIEAAAEGGFAIFEAAQIPGVPGPPLHVHRSYDEAWYVVEGRMEFQLDEDAFDCPAGSVIYAPRGTAHTFHNPGPEGARLLAVVTAEALSLVEALGKLASAGPPDPAAVAALLDRHDSYSVDRL
jgi:mannose-6-phosphate isomerase-like protein (cupin superfamily)